MFDLPVREHLPFRYLGIVPGMKKLVYPNVSASFLWTGSAVAALSGQGGIYIEAGIPLAKKEDEHVDITESESKVSNLVTIKLGEHNILRVFFYQLCRGGGHVEKG